MEGADVRRRVPERRDRHLVGSAHLRRPGTPRGDRQTAPDDAGRADEADAHVAEVHGAAAAATHARLTPEQLGEEAGQVDALRQRPPVPAVGRRQVVVGRQLGAEADGHRLLADAEVRRAVDEALVQQPADRLLAAADQEHEPVVGRQLLGRGDLLDAHGRTISFSTPSSAPSRSRRKTSSLPASGTDLRETAGTRRPLSSSPRARPNSEFV